MRTCDPSGNLPLCPDCARRLPPSHVFNLQLRIFRLSALGARLLFSWLWSESRRAYLRARVPFQTADYSTSSASYAFQPYHSAVRCAGDDPALAPAYRYVFLFAGRVHIQRPSFDYARVDPWGVSGPLSIPSPAYRLRTISPSFEILVNIIRVTSSRA